MMMVVVMVMIPAVSRRYHDDARSIASIGMMMVVMMVVLTDVELRQLDVFVRRRAGSGFVDRLQQRCGVRDWLQQLGERIRPQYIARGRTRRRRGLSGVECPERRYRSQKSSDPLFHIFSSSTVTGHIAGSRQRGHRAFVPDGRRVDPEIWKEFIEPPVPHSA
jgi:hypothetical protein